MRLSVLLASLCLVACGQRDLGTLDLMLTGTAPSGEHYRLRHADLVITGAATVAIDSEREPEAAIRRALPPGSYLLTLQPGWALERVTQGGAVAVAATLLSPNPQSFVIVGGATTHTRLRFRAGGDEVAIGDGDLDISLDVEDDREPADASAIDASAIDASAIDATPDGAIAIDASAADAGMDAGIDAGAADAGAAPPALDVLFVIDNSSGMATPQSTLVTDFSAFIDRLTTRLGVRPDLHLGVVSTSVGLGASGDTDRCRAVSDDGALQMTPRGLFCPDRPTEPFLSDIAGPGGRVVNYQGTLRSAFECISALGENGCGFEQPLEAMRRALDGSVAGNAGFLRPGAALAVIVVSNEDDCSADPALFTTATSVLGPRVSFRCFEYGVRCDPDAPRTVGDKTACVSREGSPYTRSVASYVAFLQTLRPAGRVAVGVIAAPASPVTVRPDPTSPSNLGLKPSCTSSSPFGFGNGDPAVRLAAFAAAFPSSATGSICAPMQTPLISIADAAVAALQR